MFVIEKSLIFEQSRARESIYISIYLLNISFSSSFQLYKKFSIKLILKLFETNSSFKDNHMIVFCILRQIQFKIFVLTFIDIKVFVHFFMNKFFAQYHRFSLISLIYSRRFRDFDDQIALIENIIHVVETIMILKDHIERLFFYVTNLNQYLIIMSLF